MDARITGHFPGASRPRLSGQGAQSEDQNSLHYEEKPKAAAQRNLCLNCPVPPEFCDGTCIKGTGHSAIYARLEKKAAFEGDVCSGMSLEELRAKYKISVGTMRAWAKELELELPLPYKHKPKKPRKTPQNRVHRSRRLYQGNTPLTPQKSLPAKKKRV